MTIFYTFSENFLFWLLSQALPKKNAGFVYNDGYCLKSLD
jgi:hypothetical protein